MAYKTYLIAYKRTKFDDTRNERVFAPDVESVKETMKQMHGDRVIIVSINPV